VEGRFYIEQCQRCFGLFFDPGELEALVDKSVSNVFAIDPKRIDALARERDPLTDPVSYRKCPVCRDLMNRVNFGHRSGVIADQCKPHGIWLDSGELKRLLDWRKAGGQLLHEEIREKREEERKRNERSRARSEAEPFGPLGEPLPGPSAYRDVDLLATLSGLFGKLLK
jgi:Zn-finger nucleic acid-binding protein